MNKHRHPNLPSISTLLTRPPSPPPIIVIDEEQPSSPSKTNTLRLSATLSPMLSPIDSYASSAGGSPNINSSSPLTPLPSPSMLSLPPLQGDDPPRRLRHPSISSIGSTSPKPSYNSLWSSSLPSSIAVLGSPNNISQMEFSHSPQSSVTANTAKIIPSDQQQRNYSRSASPMEEKPPLPPSTQIVLSESGQPILKRRRGRPPSMREPALEGGWTFLTPTVWNVKNQQSQQGDTTEKSLQQPLQAQLNVLPQEQKNQRQLQQANTDSIMNGSMAAFTSSNMDMVLQMPRKKRGRKPKTHIVGNSCFVWKDITASRRSTKVIKQQQEEKSNLRRLEQAPI